MRWLNQIAAVASPSTLVITGLFLLAILYTGAGINLYWFALFFCIAFYWIGSSLSQQRKNLFHLTWGWLPFTAVCYLAWLLLNPYLTDFFYFSWIGGLSLGALPIAFLAWLLQSKTKQEETWNRTFPLLVMAGIGVALWGLWQVVVYNERAHGPQIDANAFSAILNLLLIPLIWNFLNHVADGKDRWRMGALFPIAALSFVQFATYSRGGLIALLVVIPAAIWLCRRERDLWRRALVLILLLISMFLCVRLGPFEVADAVPFRELDSLRTLVDGQTASDSSVEQRLLMWQSAWDIYKDNNKLIGAGIGSFKLIYPAYRDYRDHSTGNFAHNDYLQSLQEGGLVQLAFILIFTVFAPLWLIWKEKRLSAQHRIGGIGLMLAVLAVSIHAFVNFIHYVLTVAFITGIYLARAWSVAAAGKEYALLNIKNIKPEYTKAILYTLLSLAPLALVLDAAAVNLYRDARLLSQVKPQYRDQLLHTLVTLRPKNSYIREVLITRLLRLANDKGLSQDQRRFFMNNAERELAALEQQIPGLAGVSTYKGQIEMFYADAQQRLPVCDSFVVALARVPQQTTTRLELTQCLLKRGQQREAFLVANNFKPWLLQTNDLSALAELAKLAKSLASSFGATADQRYWDIVLSGLNKHSK